MKKIAILIAGVFVAVSTYAQDANSSGFNHVDAGEVTRTLAVLTVIWLMMAFVITMTRLFLLDRLKRKMIDRETTENIIAQLLPPRKNAEKMTSLKWFLLPSAIGAGLLFVSFYPPLGLHSLAIMLFSIGAGFLAYYLVIRKQ